VAGVDRVGLKCHGRQQIRQSRLGSFRQSGHSHVLGEELVEDHQSGAGLSGDETDARGRRGGQPGAAQHGERVDELVFGVDDHRSGLGQQGTGGPPGCREGTGVRFGEGGNVAAPDDDRHYRLVEAEVADHGQ
jgi:hypothetical protein